MSEKKIIRKAALLVFKDNKIMLARSRKNAEVFYMLGGKFEPGESDEDCLKREVKEEIGCEIVPGSLKFLHEFSATPHGAGKEDILLVESVYMGEISGNPTPQSEIAEIRYFNASIDQKHLTPMSEQIFTWLVDNKLLTRP
jgi:8-oxo-dGTP diphosphatase